MQKYFPSLFTLKKPTNKEAILYIVISGTDNSNAIEKLTVDILVIKRQGKPLSFLQQTITTANLAQTAPNNWSSGLIGKVACLNLVSQDPVLQIRNKLS